MAVAAIYGGSRNNGNSVALTEVVLDGVPADAVRLDRYPMFVFQDQRHQPEGFGPLDASYAEILEQVLDCSIWVVASPVYWYGFPANMKAFIDGWSHVMRLSEWHFRRRMKGKRVYLVLTGGDNPRLKAMGLVTQFYWTTQFMGMTLVDYVIGQGDKPSEVLSDEPAVAGARRLNQLLRADLEEQI